MFRKIVEYFKNLDRLVKVIMKNGLAFCSILGIISLIILVTYNLSFTSPFLYFIGFSLFKVSLIFEIEFVICGFAADKIKKQMV